MQNLVVAPGLHDRGDFFLAKIIYLVFRTYRIARPMFPALPFSCPPGASGED